MPSKVKTRKLRLKRLRKLNNGRYWRWEMVLLNVAMSNNWKDVKEHKAAIPHRVRHQKYYP